MIVERIVGGTISLSTLNTFHVGTLSGGWMRGGFAIHDGCQKNKKLLLCMSGVFGAHFAHHRDRSFGHFLYSWKDVCSKMERPKLRWYNGSISACHAGDPGSTPGLSVFLLVRQQAEAW